MEQPEQQSSYANSDVGSMTPDKKLCKWLTLFDLQQFEDEVNPYWLRGEYDRQSLFFQNGYILCFLVDCYNRKVVDEELQEAFAEDFKEWEEADWKLAQKAFTRALRTTLRHQGCYVASNKLTVIRNLCDTAQSLENIWPQEAIAQQVTKHGGFIARSQLHSAQEDGTVKSYRTPYLTQTPVMGLPLQPARHNPVTQQQNYPPSDDNGNSNAAAIPNVTRILSDLMKTYSQADNAKKYSGERYDHLQQKYAIFVDNCRKLSLPEDQYAKAFSIMLSSRALDFYYRTISPARGMTLSQAMDMIKAQFETYEVQQGYL